MAKKIDDLDLELKKVLKMAEEKGISTSYLFKTTLERYEVQREILKRLAKQITGDDAVVEKEYVKGRKNLYIHPAIKEYNKAASAADGTVATLISIVKSSTEEPKSGTKLAKFLEE